MFETVGLVASACSLGLFAICSHLWRQPWFYSPQPGAARTWLRLVAAWLVVTAVLYVLLWATANLVLEGDIRSIFFVSQIALILTCVGILYGNLSLSRAASEGKLIWPDKVRTAVGAWVAITNLLLTGFIHYVAFESGTVILLIAATATVFGAAVGVWIMLPRHKTVN